MRDDMVQARGVCKRFGSKLALDNVALNVPRGAVYGLVGPNGAGKSTLIRCLTGAFRPDSGEILTDGEPVWENPAIKGRIAFIPDDVFYFPHANLPEMEKFYAGLYPNFDRELFRTLKTVFQLPEKQQIRRFSKGMQKQAAFWLSICCRPDVLVLDEPVDGLDPVMRRQVWSLMLSDVAERGTTVLVSSHNLRELEDVCDHVGVMHEGKMLLEHSLSELQDNITKVQYVPQNGGAAPEGLTVLHESTSGRVITMIARGSAEEIEPILQAANPVFYDLLPLTLEEIFIHELGGVNYDVKSILL